MDSTLRAAFIALINNSRATEDDARAFVTNHTAVFLRTMTAAIIECTTSMLMTLVKSENGCIVLIEWIALFEQTELFDEGVPFQLVDSTRAAYLCLHKMKDRGAWAQPLLWSLESFSRYLEVHCAASESK